MSGRPRVVAVASVVALLIVAGSAASARATLPGRNGLIAVDGYRGNDVQTWMIRPDGSELTRFPVYGEGAFSPDGRRIALSTGWKLTLTDLNGLPLQTIDTRHNGKRLFVSEPAWSPSADRIYFDNLDDPFAVPVGGGPPQQLGRGGTALDVSVTGRVAYEIGLTYDAVIYTADASGGDVRRVGRGWSASWSPDGARLAFIRNSGIFIAAADGTSAAALPAVDEASRVLNLAWSPDGTKIAMLRERSLEDEGFRLEVLDVASDVLLPKRRVEALSVSGIDWQPLQGDDQIVLPQAPALGPCDKLGAHTLLQTKRARIFTEGDRLFGCLYSTGRVVRLTQGGGIDPRLGEVALAGRFVGFEIESDGPDDGPYADLFVQNLRTGRLKRATNSVNPSSGFFYADVRKLAMTRKGAIAWVVRPYSNRGNFKPLPLLQVQKLDRNGPRLLDAGTGIKTSSFKLTRHHITWRHGKTPHSAILH
jgi:hypothetical protein